MKITRAFGLLLATLVVASGPTAAAPAAAPGPATPAWLPAGCQLLAIGPATAGYAACPPPAGFRAPNGYRLANVSRPPKVHATTGASGG